VPLLVKVGDVPLTAVPDSVPVNEGAAAGASGVTEPLAVEAALGMVEDP